MNKGAGTFGIWLMMVVQDVPPCFQSENPLANRDKTSLFLPKDMNCIERSRPEVGFFAERRSPGCRPVSKKCG